jgi:hypothetical protein
MATKEIRLIANGNLRLSANRIGGRSTASEL